MDFELIFSPDNLIQARKNICGSEKEKEINFADPEYETEVLVKRLAKTSDDMLKATALSLSDREVDILAGYLPYNHYRLNLIKLCHILKYRMTDRACRTLFSQWQESFNNRDCNAFLKALAKSSRAFKRLLERNRIPEVVFIRILEGQNIPLGFDEQLIGKRFLNGTDFANRLRYYGIIENSYLDIECKRSLMAFCGRSDYLECSEENILYIIRGYDIYMLRNFVMNFLSKMDLWELQTYPEIAEYLRSVIEGRRADGLREFFENTEPAIAEKYLNWINIHKINMYFGNDERSCFWRQYKFVNVIKFHASNVVIMEFEKYVVIEFLDIENSMLCICDKHSFRQYFYLRLNSMSETELYRYVLANREKIEYLRNHTGRWESNVNSTINKKQMGEKLPK